jgi:echinoderm microtubule-associated protein-like 1/2
LFFNAKMGKNLPTGASDTKHFEWDTHSVKLGWSVEGIYPIGQDGTHINSVAQCKTLGLLATADDFGLVNIYRDPVRSIDHQSRSYRGHSEHVTKVAFAKDGEYLFTVGGMDQTVIQWKKLPDDQ